MWFVFPQIRGLAGSPTAQEFAISSVDEATAYSDHPVLGRRLEECTRLVLDVNGRSAEDIFDFPDYLKFRSCMTLFAECATDPQIFLESLVKYFEGEPDQLTLGILKGMG